MINLEPNELNPRAHAPSLAGEHAFWVSSGRLVRRRVAGGPLEVLAPGARDGTRVSAVRVGSVEAATFVADAGSALVARLWVEGQGISDLTSPGAAANTVALVSTGSDLVALSLEGRTGMSPVHARRVRLNAAGAPKLDDDVVLWIGSSAQPLTEISAVASSSGDAWALLPIEKDITHFGLARIHAGADPHVDSDVSWRTYPNGIEPAPLATTNACGEPLVAYVRPTDAKPHSPQQLDVASVTSDGLSPSDVVARASFFADVSISAIDGGALVVWVADRRTWACTLRCRAKAK